MSLWQESMIRLARSPRLITLVQGQPWLTGLAHRFVAGPTATDAVACARRLRHEGIAVSLYYLGEYVSDATVIEQTVDELCRVMARASAENLDVAVSVDPTQIGLMIDDAAARGNARRLAGTVARAAGAPRRGRDALMLDMEDATVTDTTLDLHRSLAEAGLPVAITVQAYLHRTANDLPDLIAGGAWIRLVKGAFAEPAALAARRRADIDSCYRQAAATVLAPASRDHGTFVSFATHDHRIIDEIAVQARANGWSREDYEFEMLYGVRPDLQRALVERGHRVRVYLPFGVDWFPYAIRRVGESPRNLGFALSATRRSRPSEARP
ncbi:MAG: proline dehydrogenase family protein [Dermatophilaceae bacterium]